MAFTFLSVHPNAARWGGKYGIEGGRVTLRVANFAAKSRKTGPATEICSSAVQITELGRMK
jgi:hypothetical protein